MSLLRGLSCSVWFVSISCSYFAVCCCAVLCCADITHSIRCASQYIDWLYTTLSPFSSWALLGHRLRKVFPHYLTLVWLWLQRWLLSWVGPVSKICRYWVWDCASIVKGQCESVIDQQRCWERQEGCFWNFCRWRQGMILSGHLVSRGNFTKNDAIGHLDWWTGVLVFEKLSHGIQHVRRRLIIS